MSEVKRIDKYQFSTTNMIGQGSFGKVYKGQNTENNKIVAIKMIDKKIIEKDEYLYKGLLQEIEVMKKLRSNYIVQLEDVFETGNNYYIIQEFCDSGDFRGYLKKKKTLPESEAIGVLKDMLSGFIELLKHGVIHRDLKPENLLINQGVYKIADFGFARQVENFNKGLLTSSVGTPLYMSPQILKHDKYTTKSDIWSICVIYYEMLFGKIPWPARSQYELVTNIENQKVKFQDIGISENSKKFILQGLQIKESDRISWIEIYQHPLFQGYFNDKVPSSSQLENRAIFIINSIRQKVTRSNTNLETIFKMFGLTTQSQMDMKQFSQLMLQMDNSLSREEIEYLFNKFDENGDSTVDFQEFAKWLETNNLVQNQQQLSRRQTIQNAETNHSVNKKQFTISQKAEYIITKLNYSIQKYNLNITKLFSKFDKSGDQYLDKYEFAELIKRIDGSLTEDEIDITFQKFDENNDGSINFNEFQHTLDKNRQSHQNFNNQPNLQQNMIPPNNFTPQVNNIQNPVQLTPQQIAYNQWLEQQNFNFNQPPQHNFPQNYSQQNNMNQMGMSGYSLEQQNFMFLQYQQQMLQQQAQIQQPMNFGNQQQGGQFFNNQQNQQSFINQQQQMQNFPPQQFNTPQEYGFQQQQINGFDNQINYNQMMQQPNYNFGNQNYMSMQNIPNINQNGVIPMQLSQNRKN